MEYKKISILILTYNAFYYVFKTFVSLKKTKKIKIDYEIIVLDNNSKIHVKILLLILKCFGYLDKISFLSFNSFFAKGNNILSKISSTDSTHYLLLNSDVKINDPMWLEVLVDKHKFGVTSFGVVESDPIRVDGYCFLIDKQLYDKFQLDEEFEWWWSITKLQAILLKDGYSVQGVKKHDEWLVHYGGKSGDAFKIAKGMDISRQEVLDWFEDNKLNHYALKVHRF